MNVPPPVLAGGILGLAAGMLVLAGLPANAIWALAVIVGIDLMFAGTALILLALAARDSPWRDAFVRL